MAAIMEVDETMQKNFLQFEPAPRRGEPEVCSHCRVLHIVHLYTQDVLYNMNRCRFHGTVRKESPAVTLRQAKADLGWRTLQCNVVYGR